MDLSFACCAFDCEVVLMHEDTKHIPGEGVREFYRKQGVSVANHNFQQQLLDVLCFDFREKGWCENHGGKCQDVQEIITRLGLPPVTQMQKSEADYEALNSWREAGKKVGRKSGVVAERYRIIELLETEFSGYSRVTSSVADLIALIKGENK